MTTEAALSFSPHTAAQAAEAIQAVRHLPAMCEHALEELEIGWDGKSHAVFARIRLRAASAAIGERLEFWTARAGGRCWHGEATSAVRARFDAALARCGRRVERPTPEQVSAVMDAAVASAGELSPSWVQGQERPILTLHAGGPAWDAVAFDPSSGRLFVPTPLAPPLGDEVVVRIACADARRTSVGEIGRVVEIFRPEDAQPGLPAGFTLSIPDSTPGFGAMLASQSRDRRTNDARRAPRCRASGTVRVFALDAGPSRPSRHDGLLRDLSCEAAFVATDAPLGPGARARLEFQVGVDGDVTCEAVVTRAASSGLGVRFIRERVSSPGLDAALTGAMGRRARVLLLHDVGPARSELVNAFRRRGYDLFATDDVVHGVQVMAQESLSFDLVVVGPSVCRCDGDEIAWRIRDALGASFPVLPVCGRGASGRSTSFTITDAEALLAAARSEMVREYAAAHG